MGQSQVDGKEIQADLHHPCKAKRQALRERITSICGTIYTAVTRRLEVQVQLIPCQFSSLRGSGESGLLGVSFPGSLHNMVLRGFAAGDR